MDVELTSDLVIKASENAYDTAVLVSGDGDFAYAISTVKRQGRRVEWVSLGAMTSGKLIAASDQFTDLSQIQHWICS